MAETPTTPEAGTTDKTTTAPAGDASAAPASATPAPTAAMAAPTAGPAHGAAKESTKDHGKEPAQEHGKAEKKKAGSGLMPTIMEVLAGLKSPDKPTRNGAMLFVASLCGIAMVVILAGVHFYQVRKALLVRAETDHLEEYMKKQAEEAKKTFTTQALGTFTIQLKPIADQKPAPGVMNLAEVDIDARCDEKETCDLLKDGSEKVRNEVTTALGPMDRDELYSKEGKARLKKRILERLNAWLPKGKVEELYFSKLVIS